MTRLLALVLTMALFVASLCAGDSYAFCHVLESVASDDCCGKKPASPAIESDCCETRQFGSLPPAERATPIWLAPSTRWTIARVESVTAHHVPVAPPAFRSVPLARGAPERLAHLMRFLN